MTSFRRLHILVFGGLLAGLLSGIPSAGADDRDPLVVVQDRAWAPMAFADDQGNPQGMLVDLWRAVGEKLDRPVRFELVNWQRTLELTRDSDDRVHGGLFLSEERDAYLDYANELVPLRTALFIAAEAGTAGLLEASDLTGTEVGVTAGGYEATFLRQNHPDITLKPYPNNEALIRAATRGEIRAFAADYPVGMYYLDRHTTPDRFRVLEVLYAQPLRAAVAEDNDALMAEINRGLSLLTPAEKSRITQKWLRTERVETIPSWLIPVMSLGAGLTVLAWLLLHNRLLRHQVLSQTRDLAERERRLTLLTDNITDVVWAVGPDRRYTYVSPSIERLTGSRPEEIVGNRMGGTITPDSVDLLTEHIRRARDQVSRGEARGHVDFTVEAQMLRTDAQPLWTEVAARVFFDDAARFTGMQGVTREITERRRSRETIEQLAYYDALTGLPNRRLLLERLGQARNECLRGGEHGVLLFLDLDNFKTLNDTEGHYIGDALLQHVADRLSGSVRDDDTVARLGGDEFVVVLGNMGATQDAARRNAERVGTAMLAKLSQPYTLSGRQVHTSASIGAAIFGRNGESVENILKQADMAMYEAKVAGRGTFCFYEPSMQAAVDARARLERDLREAIQLAQFTLYYQPQVDGEGRVTGAEALLRWLHPERGMVSPAEFIGLAEETNLIAPLGQWVLETACRQLASWAEASATAGLSLSVNVSARQFEHPGFVDEVCQALERSGADPGQLKLELTESSILRDVDAAITKMARLRELGVGFALDDFGTGYSSLSYLKRLPLDQLKIDKSFVHHVLTDEDDAAIAQTVIALGRMLNLPVIAEGVETREQQRFLCEHGCHAFQGFLFGRPQPPEAFEAALRGNASASGRETA
ncbi:EAL domain-containing protein [Ectothiorhodospiraceae bacterium WFHF3C12]|nr:EAL domain-containing protein [Ectothiorhodospiraceae bacterium WFHF3C12]